MIYCLEFFVNLNNIIYIYIYLKKKKKKKKKKKFNTESIKIFF